MDWIEKISGSTITMKENEVDLRKENAALKAQLALEVEAKAQAQERLAVAEGLLDQSLVFFRRLKQGVSDQGIQVACNTMIQPLADFLTASTSPEYIVVRRDDLDRLIKLWQSSSPTYSSEADVVAVKHLKAALAAVEKEAK